MLEQRLSLGKDEWIEGEKVCFFSTYNQNGHWDGYTLQKCVTFCEMGQAPSAFMDLDGTWYDVDDFGYKMRLNDYISNTVHPNNKRAQQQFQELYDNFKTNYANYLLAVCHMHN